MILEVGNALFAYLMNCAREFKRTENGKTTDQLKEWAAKKITDRTDLFHSYTPEVLSVAAGNLVLFFMGEPSAFDKIMPTPQQ
jgi:hypothetical protein